MKKTVLSLLSSMILVSSINASDYYAKVNGEEITKKDIAFALPDPRINFDKLPEKSKKEVLNQIIDRKLISKNALKNGIEKNKDYKETMAKMKEDLAFQVWQKNELEKITLSESKKKEFYNKNRDKFLQPAKFNAKHILVKTEDEAKSLIKQLKKVKDVEKKFTELAKSKSTGPSGKNGGDLGWFNAKQMVPEFAKATEGLSKKSYTNKPVKTQFGYHIIYLKDKKDAQTVAYDKVKANIEQVLKGKEYNKKAKKLAESLRKKAKIVIK